MDADFRILGKLEVLHDGDPIELGSPRQRALLARLLISRGEAVSADRLLEDLWRGEATESTTHSLHVYVSRLRKVLGSDRLLRQGVGYQLCVAVHELDALRFEQLAAEGRAALARHDAEAAHSQLAEALSMWRGSALSEFADEEFARDEIVRLDQLRLATLEQRMWADLELGHHGHVVEELQGLVTRHPFRETLWEQLMLALYGAGRQGEALRTYQEARSILAGELGIEPGPALRLLEDRILAQDPSLVQTPKSVLEAGTSTLPLQRTSFIGREEELEQGAILLDESRLLTLTGPPGSGKTRLALRLAADHAQRFPDGAFFVPLAAISDPNMVDGAIARVLGLRQVPGETAVDGIKAFFRDRCALLVLDNFEQLRPAALLVGQLLDAAPKLTIMVTSRAPLRISGEQEFPIPPLDVPPSDHVSDLGQLRSHDAVALFVARARAADPHFELTPENARAVAEITARLDGLPLAIELAAGRIKLLPPRDLLRPLERGLTVLVGGPADTSDRHRTMRNAVAWSYELLGPEEQALFRRLGVFVGGFTLDAATAVHDASDAVTLAAVDVLLSGSLLYRPVAPGRARFAMLEVIREFALEQQVDAGEAKDAAGRHAGYFCGLAESIEPQLSRDPGGTGSQRLSAEIDNLRAALRYTLEAGETDLGLNLASCLWRYWQSGDHLIEGRDWLDHLLGHPDASRESRAKGLTARAGLAYWQADYDGAMADYAEALDLYRLIGDRPNEAETLVSMSMTANWTEDTEAAEQLADRALSLFEDLGSRDGVGKILATQGFSLFRRNQIAAAQQQYEASLAIAREVGDQHMASTLLLGIAVFTFHQGMRSEGLRILLDAVDGTADMHNNHLTVWMLDFVAAMTASAAPEAAVRLSGAADAHRREAGGGMLPESLGLEDAESVAARMLTPAEMEHARSLGRAMSLDEAIGQARQLEPLVSDVSPNVEG